MNTKDSGPAFPRQNDDQHYGELGMSLRDWFAGQALTEIAATCEAWNITQDAADQLTGQEIAKVAAGRSYMYADAMLAEREKPDGDPHHEAAERAYMEYEREKRDDE